MALTLMLALFALAVPSPALAYVDPGTGSNIVQVVIGSVFAVALGLASVKNYVKDKILNLRNKKK